MEVNEVVRRNEVVKCYVQAKRDMQTRLELGYEKFYLPLQGVGNRKGKIVKYETIIFSTIIQIRALVTEYVRVLQECMYSWYLKQSLENAVDVLKTLLEHYVLHLESLEDTLKLIKYVEKERKDFSFNVLVLDDGSGYSVEEFLQIPSFGFEEDCNFISSYGALLTPQTVECQLFNELAELCIDLKKSMQTSMAKRKTLQVIVSLQENVLGCPLQLTQDANREFIRAGALRKVCRKGVKNRWFFLFSDMVIYASSMQASKWIYHNHFSLDGCTVKDVISGKYHNSFQLLSTKKSFTLLALSEEEKKGWVSDLSQSIAKLKVSRYEKVKDEFQSSEGISNVYVSYGIVPWVPDTFSECCIICRAAFSFGRRKHHCRTCGRLVCLSCCSNSLNIARIGSISVCSICFTNAKEFFGADVSKAVICPASGFLAPVWSPDSSSVACWLCYREFSLTCRRHHCRSCGALVCSKCSAYQAILLHLGSTEKYRICDKCYYAALDAYCEKEEPFRKGSVSK